jgi:hypothetical protein
MRSWVKAGLIGGAIAGVLNVLGLVPVVGLVTCCLGILAYGGIGALAAYWMAPPRQAGPAAGEGALAGGLAAAIAGTIYTLAQTVYGAVRGLDATLAQLGPDLVQALRDAGLAVENLPPGAWTFSLLLSGGLCCLGFIVAGAALGALGGLILAALRPDA